MDCGISLRKLSLKIGKGENYLNQLRRGDFEPSDMALENLKLAMKQRGLLLSRFKANNSCFSKLYQEADLRVGKLAKQIGVSRQAINKGHLSPDKADKLSKEINKIGETLLKLSQ